MTQTEVPYDGSEMDWSAFEGEPVWQTLRCSCGSHFRGHSKINMELRRVVSKDPCPSCGRHDMIRASYGDPETQVLS